MAKVSIIVPVYGVEEYIYKCIDSLVKQTFKDIEILVVNDGTKDRSIEIIKESFNDKRIRIYDKENGGLSDARNFAFDKTTTDFIMYVDSDDYVSEDIIEKMYNAITKNDADVVVCLANQINDDVISPLDYPVNTDLEVRKRYILNRPSATCKLFRKSILNHKELTFPKGRIYEDLAIIPSISLFTNKIIFLDEYLYYYLVREGSIMNHKQYRSNMEDIFYSINNLYTIIEKRNGLTEFHDEIEYIYINHLLHTHCLFLLPYKEGEKPIKRIGEIIKEKFPNWRSNKYYKKRNIRYKIVCNLFYRNRIKLAKLVLRKYMKKQGV